MNKHRLALFLLLAAVQLFIPLKTVWDQENTIRSGTPYKFETSPIDPSDPFRGKYILLDYRETAFPAEESYNGNAYIVLTRDAKGFAKIQSVEKTKPRNTREFVRAEVHSIKTDEGKIMLIIEYPFNKFYVEESKAHHVETMYNTVQDDKNTFALVHVKNGLAVLTNVYIAGTPVSELTAQ